MLPNLRDLCISLHGVFRVTILQSLAIRMVDINRAIRNLKQQINTCQELAASRPTSCMNKLQKRSPLTRGLPSIKLKNSGSDEAEATFPVQSYSPTMYTLFTDWTRLMSLWSFLMSGG
jgi:hypothetical protein